MNLWGIVVAAGSGTRFGTLKQLETLAGRQVLEWSVAALRSACETVVVVVPAPMSGSLRVPGADVITPGGATRSGSVRAGLAAVGGAATHVLVHDAARPLASAALVGRVVAALSDGAAGVVPVVAVKDSLRTVDGASVDRTGFVAAQTPQGFEIDLLRRAHESGTVATDDATLLDRLGARVVHVEGESRNLKITEPDDLAIAEVLLRRHDRDRRSGGRAGRGC
jgi:2-C-methyl-D-erythritol 4-phosphate cytidylyltransferase